MTEELDMIYGVCREQMQKAIDHLENEVAKIRAGKASPQMVSGIHVDYYGTMSPLNQVANIATPDARTISIQPWEKSMVQPIEKAILEANIGLTPQNNGEMVMLNIPALTEERRKQLVKQVHAEAEHARVGLRQARKQAMDEIKALQKDGLSEDLAHDAAEEVDKITKGYDGKVDQHVQAKEAEIMTV
jgi:ribosome recycling factor